MMNWFRPILPSDIQAAVLDNRDRHCDPIVRRKMLVLWAVHLGHTREQAAWRTSASPPPSVTSSPTAMADSTASCDANRNAAR
jgi:hypothetical protein